jgi:serine/threonine protein kinase
VRLLGRSYPVIGRVAVRRRTYLLLDRLSVDSRQRYLAYDPCGAGGLPVVVMVLPRSPAAKQHIEVLKRLSAASNSLPQILDYDSQRDQTIVVLKWIRGVTLSRYYQQMTSGQKPRISPVLAVRRARGLAHGLRALHTSGQIVHGDVKPDNIVLATESGHWSLIDFGSAWQSEATLRRDSGDGTTPVYSAPELQHRASHVDWRVDQFSLSVILYELLTFQIPYGGLGGKAGRGELSSATIPRLKPPSELKPDRSRLPALVWQGIDRIVVRGLSLNPDLRYPTPEAWLNDFDIVDLDIRRPQALSPLNDRLTTLVSWLMNSVQRNKAIS